MRRGPPCPGKLQEGGAAFPCSMRRYATVALVAALLVAPVLAGCVGSDGSETGPAAAPGDPEPASPNGSEDAPDDGSSGPGGSEDGNGTGESPPARTPDDAMEPAPADAEPGMAHFRIEETSQFAFHADVVDVGECGTSVQSNPVPAGSQCSDRFNLTLRNDVTRVEVLVQWEGERTDLNLLLNDPNGKNIESSSHGQVFINRVCEHPANPIGECIFVWAPNGTTWEYVTLPAEKVEPGTWTIHVGDKNNFEQGHVESAAGQGEGVPYTLDVWVYTVEADPVHDPTRSSDS